MQCGSWCTEAAELKREKSLMSIKSNHNEEMERLQAELAAASKKLHESLDDIAQNKSATQELKELHEVTDP